MATPPNGNQASESARSEAPSSQGFAGSLRCASLADLVQLQCLSRTRSAVTVNSDGRSGQLYFDGGEIVHAATQQLSGDAAALEILAWEGGSFGMVDLEWPVASTLTVPWQHLLLRSAQRQDEARRDFGREGPSSASRVVAVPQPVPQPIALARSFAVPRPVTLPRPDGTRVVVGTPVPCAPTPNAELPAPSALVVHAITAPRMATVPQPVTVPEPSVEARDPFPMLGQQLSAHVHCVVRLDHEGQVLDSRGEGHGLANLCGFVRRIIDLVGDDLGLPSFRCFESQSSTRQILFYPETERTFLALELSAAADLASLRAALVCP